MHDFVANRGEAACYDREKKASCDGVLHRERPQSTPHHQFNGENDAASSWRPAPMLCDPNALGSLSLGLTNIMLGQDAVGIARIAKETGLPPRANVR